MLARRVTVRRTVQMKTNLGRSWTNWLTSCKVRTWSVLSACKRSRKGSEDTTNVLQILQRLSRRTLRVQLSLDWKSWRDDWKELRDRERPKSKKSKKLQHSQPNLRAAPSLEPTSLLLSWTNWTAQTTSATNSSSNNLTRWETTISALQTWQRSRWRIQRVRHKPNSQF